MSHQTEGEDRDERTGIVLRRPYLRLRAPSRRHAQIAAGLVGGALALVCAVVGLFFLLLSRGPITFSWLAPRIVVALEEMSGGKFDFQLAGASIANTDHGPTLSVSGLVVKNGGRAILAAPRAELSLDFRSLLLGRVKPRRLEVLDLDLRLSVLADGTFAVSAGADSVATPRRAAQLTDASTTLEAPVNRAALLREAVAALRGLMDLATNPNGEIGALDRLGVSHGRLLIDDRTVDRVIQYNDVTLSLDKGDGAMRFSLAASGPSRRWTAQAIAKGAPGERRDFHAILRNLSIDEINLVGGFRASKFDTDAPLGFDLTFSLAPDDSLSLASGGVEIGKGIFRLDEPDHEPVMIDRITATANWDRGAHKLVLAPARFKAGGFDMSIAGEARAPPELPLGADPGADAWGISLRLAKSTVVAPERAAQKPVAIDAGVFEARVMNGLGRIVVDKFAFSGPEVKAALTAELSFRDDIHVRYQLDAGDTQIGVLARLWPTHVAAPVRAWLSDHLSSGLLKHARCIGDFDSAALTAMRYDRPPPDASLLIEGEIANAAISEVLPGLAPLTGVGGNLRITGRTSSFIANSGVLEAAPGRRLVLSEGRFSVADSALRPTPAVVSVKVSGNVEAVADILSLPAVAPHASLPVDSAVLKGQIDGKLRVDFEIGIGARDEATTIFIDATTANLNIERLIGKERLENASLHVVADRVGLRVDGSGRIFGAPVTLNVTRGFGDKGAAQAQVTFAFDEAARQRAGYVLPGVNGPVNATVRTPLPVEEVNSTQIDLDFTRTTFDSPVPGLTKPAGKAAKATFIFSRRTESITLDQFSLDAGATQAKGVIELARDGAFRAARFSHARLSAGDDMRLDVQRNGDTVKIIARATNFDARPMMQSLLHSDRAAASAGAARGASSIDDVDIDFKSPIVTGHGRQILSNVDLKYERRGGRPRAVSLAGSFGRDQLSVSLARAQNGSPQLEVTTSDGGSFLAFLDIYRKMESGALGATVQLGQNRADGALRIRDFYVKGEPTMRELMAQSGSARADEKGVVRFDPDSVRVGQLLTDFTWSAGRLSVRDGVMSGPEIGLTFDGFIDFPRDRLDLSGSYVPAYALNSLLSNIPVVGVVIAGGQNEGIFALNYRVTGTLTAPVVRVNPLSAIAPGLIRKIMGVLDGTARVPDGR